MSAADDSKIISGFEKGTVIAAVSGSWNATDLQRVLGENLGTAKLPTVTIEGEQVQLSSYAGYKLIGVNGYSKNKGEAHKLALWLTNYDNQMTRYRARGFAPTNLRAAENEEVKADPILSALAAQRQFARTQKDVPVNYWTPTKGFGNALIGAKDGSMTKEKLKQQLVAMCENIRKTA
jgi:arabinogalactan oligomer/maltooligosaccharide transport system substrate-binding protein